NNGDGLIESHPHPASEGARITEKPSVFVIVGRASFSGSGQPEAQGRSCAGSSAARKHVFHQLRRHPSRARIKRGCGDMRCTINRFVRLVVDSLDDVSLFAHSGVWENGVRRGKVLEVCLEGTDVNRRPAWNI